MKEILTKISSYDLFNNLFPGTLFVVLAEKFLQVSLIQKDIVMGLFLYYFIGMIISRIGSLIIEPILQILKFIVFEPYSEYIKASKKDEKLDLLSQVNNTYRTLLAMVLLLIGTKAYLWLELKWVLLKDLRVGALLFIVLLMLLFSYRKQTGMITKRIRTNNS